MTSLLICYPDIPYNAITITPSAAIDATQNEWNLVSGERRRGFCTAAAGASIELVFDLGSDFANKQATLNYFAVARADKLQDGAVSTLTIYSSPDNSAWTQRIAATSFSSVSLVGPRAQDYIQTISATSAFRYWRYQVLTPGTSKFPHSKLYFGNYFDFGREPSSYRIERNAATTEPFTSSSGSQIGERIEEPRYHFEFTWTGITDAKIAAFQSAMGKSYYRENGVFLYSASLHHVLDNQQLVHCRMVEPRSRKLWNNYHEVTINFEEMIG